MHSVYGPASPQAASVAHLWWWMLGVGAAVWLLVLAATVLAVTRARGEPGDDGVLHVPPAVRARIARVVSAATFVTVLILGGFLAFDFVVGRSLADRPHPMLTIEVTGHQWWWDVEYDDPDPSKRVTTANEIHVPVGVPVQLVLHAADVIHSFWVPSLSGKKDLIPGYTSSLWFEADTAGVYRGQCAEFCGLEHAKMAMWVVAEPRAAYAAWYANASAGAPPPGDSTAAMGARVFLGAGCAVCHAIGGTQAMGTVGPSLSHLASRRTLAAGVLANTRGALTGWILDPQAIKPGARMPAVPLTGAQVTALVDYLETLK